MPNSVADNLAFFKVKKKTLQNLKKKEGINETLNESFHIVIFQRYQRLFAQFC